MIAFDTIKKPYSLLFAAAILIGLSAGSAQAVTSPFIGMAGTWAGSGAITLASGAKESIRCRATYNVNGTGTQLDLVLRCASASYKFELQSNVASNNGSISGTWAELTRRVGGTVSGSANAGRIQASVQGTVTARLAMSTKANTQTVFIESPGSPMSAVTISLSKAH
jgi:hypothetical protein